MRVWLASLIVLISCSCVSSSPPQPEHTFGEFERMEETATFPEELPVLALGAHQCGVKVCIDPAAIDRIQDYTIVAEENTSIAIANATALISTQQAANKLLDAGTSLEHLNQLRADQWEFERRDLRGTLWWQRGLIALMLIAGGLAAY